MFARFVWSWFPAAEISLIVQPARLAIASTRIPQHASNTALSSLLHEFNDPSYEQVIKY